MTKNFHHTISSEDLLSLPDPLHIPSSEIETLQLEQLRQRFAQCREHIPALQRAAQRTGITHIERLSDVIPLLFSHMTYKSYPETLLDNQQWDQMNRWLATFSTRGDEIRNIDLAGVITLDDWLAALDRHGFAICHSSGTTGKPSFFPRSASEIRLLGRAFCRAIHLGFGLDAERDKLPFFAITFASGWGAITRASQQMAQAYSPSPDMVEFAFNETLSPTATRQMQKMRKLAAEGALLPDQLCAFERMNQEKQQSAAEAFEDFVRRTLTYQGQRILLHGHRATTYQLALRGLEMGKSGVFAPNSIILHAGGNKGVALPEDYEQQIASYFGARLENVVDMYGMTERNSTQVSCTFRRKHCPPWEIPLILSPDGETLLNPAQGQGGTITGRYAFFDLLASTYWGGVTTGDCVTVSFDPCPCGWQGPQILDITRFTELPDAPDEDKLSCAAEMTSYVMATMGH